MRIDTMLSEEIKSELEELKKLEVGSDKYKATVEGITKLTDRVIEMDKNESDFQERVDSRVAENELKEKQLIEDRKDRRIKNGISIGTLFITSAVTVWGTLKTLKFEEVGTVTTIVGRNFIGRLFKK